jgi:response regulator RpfG family c-di-GMP phosphodiesterase
MDRLLFVDDEPDVLRAMRRMFERAGYQVETAPGPLEALQLLRASPPFDVICSDYSMPQMNGVELLKQARAMDDSIYRILVTAVSDFDVAVDAINDGGVHRLLAKPWNIEEFANLVREGCEGRRMKRQVAALTDLVHQKNIELERFNSELQEIVEERTTNVLEGLTCALDYRDSETQWHSRRVALYCRRVSEQLGVKEEELMTIERGAILLKAGPLTPDEWVVMKKHPTLGYELLRNIPLLEPARQIVLQHQERFDGKGYPQGLRGEEILVGARVFSVVDALDAITSDRPYRKAQTFEAAQAEILRCAGSQFDPKVVEAFLAVPKADFEAIHVMIDALAAADQQKIEREAPRNGAPPPAASAA